MSCSVVKERDNLCFQDAACVRTVDLTGWLAGKPLSYLLPLQLLSPIIINLIITSSLFRILFINYIMGFKGFKRF